jgi:putative endonuclease
MARPKSPPPRTDSAAPRSRRAAGIEAERLAALHLRAHGLEILLRNYRRRTGELDLVARDGDLLLVVEVRMRSSAAYGGAAASIDGRKRARIIRTTAQLLQRRRDLRDLRVRFDVMLVGDLEAPQPTLEWIRHAFET